LQSARSVVLAVAVAGFSPGASAEDARWYFQTSATTRHFRYDPRHNNHPNLINVERWSGRDAIGLAFFDNSFDQPSQYVYWGRLWRPLDSAPLVHVKLTAGLLHGYKVEYRDKIPYNSRGIAPSILPAVGVSGKRFAGEVVLLWRVGAMVTVGVYFE